MKIKILVFALFSCFYLGFSQEEKNTAQEIKINEHIDGTLLSPTTSSKHLVIIIAGSGPTDRDGNQNFLKGNSLRKLAYGITNKGVATFRYDKRIVKQIRKGNVDKNMMFDDFITDAVSVIDYFKKQGNYSKIYVAGHSQGSLVGILAAKNRADGFISLAGAGQSIDKVKKVKLQMTFLLL